LGSFGKVPVGWERPAYRRDDLLGRRETFKAAADGSEFAGFSA